MADKKRLEGKRILIVDDEPDVLETLEEFLTMCHVTAAGTFAAAKELLETQHFDMAILDIMGVDGYELLKIANERKVTAVMLTAHALSTGNIKKSYKEGAAYYVPKDEIANITEHLEDVLEAIEQGKSTWWRWYGKLAVFCELKFGPDWQIEDKEFWEKFKFHI